MNGSKLGGQTIFKRTRRITRELHVNTVSRPDERIEHRAMSFTNRFRSVHGRYIFVRRLRIFHFTEK